MLNNSKKTNAINRTGLRVCIGKAMHIASLIQKVRPFLSELYAAYYADTDGPIGDTIWTRQILHTLTWLIAFLDESAVKLSRTYDYRTYLGGGTQVTICLDASPWGLGGFLVEDLTIVSWFACSLSQEELDALRITKAESAAQQVVEALAVLVALRAWKRRWAHRRILLEVKSDSISALAMSLKTKASGYGTSIIARELALDIAQSEYKPDVAEHIPGVDNVLADVFSRKHMSGSD